VTLVDAIVLVLFGGVLAYGVFGGADFGSGFWDLFAGGPARGADLRRRIDRSVGPVWEANHVWLIFILVYLWTAFPKAFAALATALYVPLIGAGVGIVMRGAAFALRKSSQTLAQARFYGALFASSSVVTPFFFGTCVGAVVSGRVPAEGVAPAWSTWLGPASLLGGTMAVGTCAWLAAVFLAADCEREDEPALAARFRARALGAGVALGALSLAGVIVLERDAPVLAARLETWGAPLVTLSAVCGLWSLQLLRRGRAAAARTPAVLAVVAILAGWALGQYPWILVGERTLAEAAAAPGVLRALLWAFALAAVLVVPALVWLFVLTQRGALSARTPHADSSAARLGRGDAGRP
jgi:cytochrome d ubiquinol oxidase subunit II